MEDWKIQLAEIQKVMREEFLNQINSKEKENN